MAWLTGEDACGAECVEAMDNQRGHAFLATAADVRHPLHTVCDFKDETPHDQPFYFCADNLGALCGSCFEATHNSYPHPVHKEAVR